MAGFGFPCGVAPRFDPVHIAAANCTLSAVASAGSFIDLQTGAVGTATGSPTVLMHNVIGPSLKFSAANVAITGKRTYGANGAPLADTMAGIFVTNATAAAQCFLSLGTNGTDTGFSVLASAGANTTVAIAHAGVTVPSSFGYAIGTPMFVAASQSLSAASAATQTWGIVYVNLSTGQYFTLTGTQGSYNVGSRNGTYNIGSRGAASQPATASIACVMASDTYLPLSELVMWAADPWSFWYPQK